MLCMVHVAILQDLTIISSMYNIIILYSRQCNIQNSTDIVIRACNYMYVNDARYIFVHMHVYNVHV